MKHKGLCFGAAAMIVAVSALMAAGCGKKEENLGDKFILGEDNQYYFSGHTNPMAESEDAYYVLGGWTLFSVDKATGEAAPLCDKPDCLHDQETDLTKTTECNAYFGGARYIQYYHDKLYVYADDYNSKESMLNNQTAVYAIDKSGSTREAIMMPEENVSAMIVHRGYIYASYTDFLDGEAYFDKNPDKLKEASYRVERYKIDSKSKKLEIIYEKKGEYGQINSLWAYGNRIYITRSGPDGKETPDLIYNLQTEKITETDMNTFIGTLPVGDKLLVNTALAGNGDGFAWADFDGNQTGTAEIKPDLKEGETLKFCGYGDYIAMDCWMSIPEEGSMAHPVQIFDKTGKKRAVIDLENRTLPVIGMNQDKLFYLQQGDDADGSTDVWAVDLSRLDEEGLKGEPFFIHVQPENAGGVVIE